MEATVNEISSVNKWLQDTHHVSVNNDWLQSCICYLKESNGDHIMQQCSLQQEVYDQWLMSHLNESGVSLLPSDIATSPKGNLHGILPLQMNTIVNVGESAYSQYKKLKGEDTSATELKPTQFQQQQSPSRLLKMELTDGECTIEAIEYKPISTLNTGLPPGTKLMVKGGPLYRNGIVFLEESNIKILGGQVEGLLEENATINILYQLAMKNANPEQLANNNRNNRPNGVETMTSSRDDENKENKGIDNILAELMDEDVSYLAELDLDVMEDDQTAPVDTFDMFDEMVDDIPDDVLVGLMDGDF